MAIITCNHCQRENEIPDDEACPGYMALIDALKEVRQMLSTVPLELRNRVIYPQTVDKIERALTATEAK